jgi:hypothetical protein
MPQTLDAKYMNTVLHIFEEHEGIADDLGILGVALIKMGETHVGNTFCMAGQHIKRSINLRRLELGNVLYN